MEFLVGFDVTIPDATSESEVKDRASAEAIAAARLAREGHLVRLWTLPLASGESKVVGLYRAESEPELDGLLGALPLNCRMQTTVTPLEPHPNDPTSPRPSFFQLPDPRLMPVYRLEATLGEPVELGDSAQGHRRIAPLTGGTFIGTTLNGKAAPRRQRRLADGAARRHRTRRHPLHPANQRRGGPLCSITGSTPRPRRGLGAAGSGRGRRRERIYVPYGHPDRDSCR